MTIRQRVLAALGILLVCLAALIAVGARHYFELIDAQGWSTHSYEVLRVFSKLEVSLDTDRGFAYCALTGHRTFARSAEQKSNYESNYQALLELTRDNDLQTQNLVEFDRAWQRWQTEFVAPIRAYCDQPTNTERPTEVEVERLGEIGLALRGELRGDLAKMELLEQSLLESRRQRLDALQSLTADVLLVIGTVTVILAVLTGTSLVRAASRQDEMNAEMGTEVEQRRAIAKRLVDSEMRVRAVLENVPDGIVTIDAHGIIQSFNPSAEAIFGFVAEEVIGRNISMLMPEPSRSAHTSYVERFRSDGTSRVVGRRRELVGLRADGTRFPMDLAVTEIEIDNERMFTGIVRDISEVKRQSEEINRFKAVLDKTLDMIVMFDPVTMRFVYANRGVSHTLGFNQEELMRMRASEIVSAMPEHVFRSHIAQLMSGDKPVLTYETMQLRKDGAEVPVEMTLQLVRDGEDDPGLFIAIARDLTERHRVDRLKSEFISIVSHELRTPLTSIRGSLGLLVGGAAGEMPPRAFRMVEIAHHNSERLIRLINDMLDMEKIESGKMRFDMRPIELTHLVQLALDANRGFAHQYDVELVADEISPTLRVYADPDRLMQVMANYLSNAIKFSPAHGTVTIAASAIGKMVRVEITDHGTGIPEEFRDRVFMKFSQADASDTRKKGGTGLGLSICKAIIERQDGTVGYRDAAGGGTIFWFELPAWTSPVVAGALGAPRIVRPKILICEDEFSVASGLAELLDSAGYETEVARDAGEARALLRSQRFSVVALDIDLPGQDGTSFLREMASATDIAMPPVVVVSSEGTRRGPHPDAEFAGGHTVLAWLERPIDEAKLLAALKRGARAPGQRVEILHVEDDSDVRRILETLMGDLVHVTGVASVGEAVIQLADKAFDLVVLDVGLPDASGLELLPFLTGHNLHVPVLVFSAHDPSPELAQRVRAALVKSRTSNQELLDTVRRLVM